MDGEHHHIAGQDTLVASWRALAACSPGASVVTSNAWVTAIFPAWVPLNNAIALCPPEGERFHDALAALARAYDARGVAPGAVWIPAESAHFDAPDRVQLAGLERDDTTLVMCTRLNGRFVSHDDVRATSVAGAALAGDAPVPVHELGAEDGVPGLRAWVLVQEGTAVAGLWSMLHGHDCGLYAVGTAPTHRRRGIAQALVGHALADAARRGARTATLQSTPMGRPLYESLGFTAVGRYEEWVWA
jgi:ribosomal protein S18 acetylase RimI-like enzyme